MTIPRLRFSLPTIFWLTPAPARSIQSQVSLVARRGFSLRTLPAVVFAAVAGWVTRVLKRRARRPTRAQFSLAGALLAMAAICVALAFIVAHAHRQRQAVRLIRAAGGECYYDYQYFRPLNAGFGHIQKDASSPVPDWALRTFGLDYFSSVVVVSVPEGAGREACLGAASGMTWIEELHVVFSSDIRASEIDHLKKLRKLHFVLIAFVGGLNEATVHAVCGAIPPQCHAITTSVPTQ